MSDERERLRQRIAEFEAERDRLLAEFPKPLTKRQVRERREVSRDLALHERRLAAQPAHEEDPDDERQTARVAMPDLALVLRSALARLEARGGRASWFVALAFVVLAGAVALVAMARGRDDVRWVETTCELRQEVDADGDGYTVTIPANRPDWQSDRGCGGRCWVMEPEGPARTVLCEAPSSPRVSRWAQVGANPRLAMAALLWGAVAALIVGARWRWDD